MALAWGENGFRHMTNSKRPVNVPDDLKGLKMRTMENPIHIQAYKRSASCPTPMAFTEVFTALQQGTVDGQENPLSVITAAKLDQVQKNLTLTGHVYSPALILMNKAQWDKLSPADKQAFHDAAKEAVKANRARIDDDEKKAVADLRAKGMQVVENVDKAKFQAVLAPTSTPSSASDSARTTSTGSRTTSEPALTGDVARTALSGSRTRRQQRAEPGTSDSSASTAICAHRNGHSSRTIRVSGTLRDDRRHEQQPADRRRDHPHRQVDDDDDAELQVVDAERMRDRREDRHQHDDAGQRLDEDAEDEQQHVDGEEERERRQVHRRRSARSTAAARARPSAPTRTPPTSRR